MLGELVAEERGKMTGYHIPAPAGGEQKVEVTFRAAGKFLGMEHTGKGTYWSVVRPDGTVYGEGDGEIVTKDGETAAWVGQGTGRLKQGGGVSLRGAIYFQSESPSLTRLNGVAVVFEHEVDAHDNITTRLWEWK